MKQYLQDIIGKKFGVLTVVAYAGKKHEQNVFLCRCDCGNEIIRKYTYIIHGTNKDCPNCRSKYSEINKTKEFSHLYCVWCDITNRTSKNNKHNRSCYKKHNIEMCAEWRNDFTSFFKWAMENGYKYEKLSNGMNKWTIDRIDPYKGYCPENCRWITIQEQQRNKLDNKIIEFNGKEYKLWELADKFNIDKEVLYNRIFVYKWDVNRSVSERVKPRRIILEYNGKPITLKEIAELAGIAKTSVTGRLKKGWSIDKIISTPRQNDGHIKR